MKTLIFFPVIFLFINVLQSKKYLVVVAEDEMADRQKAGNTDCRCGVEMEERKSRIVGGREVNLVR